jgi:hypothetical protein
MADREQRGERTGVRRAPGMAPARRQGAGHSREICRDVVRGVDGAVGRRQCQEGVMERMRHGAAPGVHGSGQGACPRGERLEASRSAVQRGYSAGEGTQGSGSLRQGSKEHVTSWSVTITKKFRGTIIVQAYIFTSGLTHTLYGE